jgi:hypothetical protein
MPPGTAAANWQFALLLERNPGGFSFRCYKKEAGLLAQAL